MRPDQKAAHDELDREFNAPDSTMRADEYRNRANAIAKLPAPAAELLKTKAAPALAIEDRPMQVRHGKQLIKIIAEYLLPAFKETPEKIKALEARVAALETKPQDAR